MEQATNTNSAARHEALSVEVYLPGCFDRSCLSCDLVFRQDNRASKTQYRHRSSTLLTLALLYHLLLLLVIHNSLSYSQLSLGNDCHIHIRRIVILLEIFGTPAPSCNRSLEDVLLVSLSDHAATSAPWLPILTTVPLPGIRSALDLSAIFAHLTPSFSEPTTSGVTLVVNLSNYLRSTPASALRQSLKVETLPLLRRQSDWKYYLDRNPRTLLGPLESPFTKH